MELELYILVDENGDYVVAKDQDDLTEAYDENVEGDSNLGRRIIKVVLAVDLPTTIKLWDTVEDITKAKITQIKEAKQPG